MKISRLAIASTVLTLGLAVACGDNKSPTSPTSSPGSGNLGPDGSTLKIPAPELLSPANGAQLQGNPVLAFTNVNGTYKSFPVTYELEVRDPANAVVVSPKTIAADGPATNVTITQPLAFDTVYTWRVRATFGSGVGPWSASRTFRTQPAGYVRGNEVFDPLTNGRTVGTPSGNVQFIPGTGVKFVDQAAFMTYILPENLQAGEFSVLTTGVDDGSPGDKSKIISMQEGPEMADITDDDYRMTVELRGRDYGAPGSISCRIIPGDGDSNDCPRSQVDFSDTRWYFWRFRWQTGSASLTVRADSETGPVLYDVTIGTGTHPYRPVPHFVHLGSPAGRNGLLDATIGGLVVKNVWVSSNPRPTFPSFNPTSLASLIQGPGR